MKFEFEFYKAKQIVANHRVASLHQQLMDNQLLDSTDLEQKNLRKLSGLVDYCYDNIPFYRRLYSDAGFRRGDIRSESDFNKLPILEKADIRESSEEMFSLGIDRSNLRESATGGTTGQPLRTYSDKKYPLQVISWRSLGWLGISPHQNSGYAYRNVPVGWRASLYDAAHFPTKRAFLSASSISSESLKAFYRSLVKINAKYVMGYVGAVDAFAEYLDDQGLTMPGLEAVWTTAAPLPESRRSYMESVYSAPVYTQYGSCEFYWIASECRHKSGLHIATDLRHVSLDLDSLDPSSKVGDLLVTDLENLVFPLVRYRLGDRGKLLDSSCPCGLPFKMMDYVRGRTTDSITLANGQLVPGEYWTTIFDDFVEEINSFRVHQKSDHAVVIYYKLASPKGKAAIETVKRRMLTVYGADSKISFVEGCGTILDSGKYRFVQSDLGV